MGDCSYSKLSGFHKQYLTAINVHSLHMHKPQSECVVDPMWLQYVTIIGTASRKCIISRAKVSLLIG